MRKLKNEQSGFAVEIVLVILALVLLGAGVFYFLEMGPKQKVNSVANDYVKQSVDGNYDAALKLTDSDKSQEAAAKKFSTDIDEQVGSSNYKVNSTEINGDKATVKLIVDNDTKKTIRLELSKVRGEWLITGVFYSIKTPATSDKAADSATPAPAPIAAAAAQSPQACLPAGALQKFWRYTAGWQFYFKPDTDNLAFGDAAAIQSVVEMQKFYDDNSKYSFSYVIDVSLYQASGTASDVALAKKRAGVVAYNMNARGIPYARIRFGKATSGGDPNTPQYAAGSRNAVVSINASCDALTATPQDYTADNAGR